MKFGNTYLLKPEALGNRVLLRQDIIVDLI